MACSITLRDAIIRIILCTDRIMLWRKDVARDFSALGIQWAWTIFLHTAMHKSTSLLRDPIRTPRRPKEFKSNGNEKRTSPEDLLGAVIYNTIYFQGLGLRFYFDRNHSKPMSRKSSNSKNSQNVEGRVRWSSSRTSQERAPLFNEGYITELRTLPMGLQPNWLITLSGASNRLMR